MKIRTRMILAALIVTAIANIIYGVFFLEREGREARALLQTTIEETNRLLASVMAGPLYDGNVEHLSRDLDSFFLNPDIVHIALTETRGDIEIKLDRASPSPLGELIEDRVQVNRGIDALGEIRVVYTTANIENRLLQLRSELVLMSVAFMLGLAVVILLVARGLTKPIDRLTAAAQAMTDGKLDQHIEPTGSREVVVLGQSFIRMRDAIREQMTALADKNRQLELEVAQRGAAERERDRLISVVEATTDLISMSDPQGKILYLNHAGRRLTGIGDRPVEELQIPDLHPPWATALILSTGVPTALRDGYWSGDTALLGPDQHEFPVSQVILSHRDGQGEVEYLSTIMRDVTERKQTEQELRELTSELETRVQERTAELERTNKELESFSYSVSHDLRAPLRAIDGFSRLLLEDYGATLEGEAQDYLIRVRKAVQRMGNLIDDLLNLSRVSRAELRPATVDLSRLATEIAAELREGNGARAVDVSIAPGLTAQGDPQLLRVALHNLLGNAWKYTGKTPQARIEFGAFQQDDETVYFVRDNGAGFDMQYAGKLFGAFQRLHTEREFAGTGIGLATVARIVHRHGGEIWAEGVPGVGATFYFILASPPGTRPEPHPAPDGKAPRQDATEGQRSATVANANN
jgi:PAS domain S-box-containing protein